MAHFIHYGPKSVQTIFMAHMRQDARLTKEPANIGYLLIIYKHAQTHESYFINIS